MASLDKSAKTFEVFSIYACNSCQTLLLYQSVLLAHVLFRTARRCNGWLSVNSVTRVLPLASRCPTPTGVPTGRGSPRSSGGRQASMVPLAMCTFVPGVCVPVKLPELSNIWNKRSPRAPFGTGILLFSLNFNPPPTVTAQEKPADATSAGFYISV